MMRRIQLAGSDGTSLGVTAEIFDAFGVHQSPEPLFADLWMVTHIRSGRRAGNGWPTHALACTWTATLLRLPIDWDVDRPNVTPALLKQIKFLEQRLAQSDGDAPLDEAQA